MIKWTLKTYKGLVISLSHALTTNMTQTIDCFQIQSTTLCEPFSKYLTSNIGDTEEYVVREEAIWGRSTSKFNPYYLFYLFILSFYISFYIIFWAWEHVASEWVHVCVGVEKGATKLDRDSDNKLHQGQELLTLMKMILLKTPEPCKARWWLWREVGRWKDSCGCLFASPAGSWNDHVHVHEDYSNLCLQDSLELSSDCLTCRYGRWWWQGREPRWRWRRVQDVRAPGWSCPQFCHTRWDFISIARRLRHLRLMISWDIQ